MIDQLRALVLFLALAVIVGLPRLWGSILDRYRRWRRGRIVRRVRRTIREDLANTMQNYMAGFKPQEEWPDWLKQSGCSAEFYLMHEAPCGRMVAWNPPGWRAVEV